MVLTIESYRTKHPDRHVWRLGLDGMDVMVYSFVIPSLIAVWHISGAGRYANRCLAGFGCGRVARGTVGGPLRTHARVAVDRIWFSFFTFLSGFTHLQLLLICRGFQGLGFGGEWAVGSVLMGETIRAEHRGKAVGSPERLCDRLGNCRHRLHAAVLVSPAIAWRAMFWIGILPAFLVFYIRRIVPEPECFRQDTHKQLEAKGSQATSGYFFAFGSSGSQCLHRWSRPGLWADTGRS